MYTLELLYLGRVRGIGIQWGCSSGRSDPEYRKYYPCSSPLRVHCKRIAEYEQPY